MGVDGVLEQSSSACVNLAKYCQGPSQSIWDWGTTPRTAKGRVWVGMEGDWIGFGVGLCLDSL